MDHRIRVTPPDGASKSPTRTIESMIPKVLNPTRWSAVVAVSMVLSTSPERMTAQTSSNASVLARDAIVRGVRYMSAPDLNLERDAALIYAYLMDRFGLPEACGIESTLSELKEEGMDHPLYVYLRMADSIPFDPDFLLPQGDPDDVTICGMWYDQLPRKEMLADRIRALDLNEPYAVTHAVWAMTMAQQCFQAGFDALLERQLITLNSDIIDQVRPHWNDVGFEALAMAQFHDPTYIPPPAVIQEITDLQNPDGSWNITAGDTASTSQHSTVWCLWALLQYRPLDWPVSPRDIIVR